jgi:hypothetical protein
MNVATSSSPISHQRDLIRNQRIVAAANNNDASVAAAATSRISIQP